MIYLLDANILIDFQNASLLDEFANASQVVDIAVAEKVFEEITLPKSGDSDRSILKKRAAKNALRNAKIEQVEVMPGTPQQELMEALLSPRKNSTVKDRGEAASIAVASAANHLVFVTRDDNATFWALNELFGSGERVMREPVFIRVLFEHNAISKEAVRKIAEQITNNLRAIPTWWDNWLSKLDKAQSPSSSPSRM